MSDRFEGADARMAVGDRIAVDGRIVGKVLETSGPPSDRLWSVTTYVIGPPETAGRNRFPALPSSGRERPLRVAGTWFAMGDLVRVRSSRVGDDGRTIETLERCPSSEIGSAAGFVTRACGAGEVIVDLGDWYREPGPLMGRSPLRESYREWAKDREGDR